MTPLIATTISLWSRYSLALSLSSIADPVRDKLDALVRHFSHLVAVSTLAVALGVIMEGIELVHAFVEWRKRKRREKRGRIQLEELRQIVPISEDKRKLPKSHSEEPPWAKLVLRVGLILVVVGVVGEWRCGAELEDAHNAVHEYDLGKITEADRKAGDAIEKAAKADLARVQLEASMAWRRMSEEQGRKLCSVLGPKRARAIPVMTGIEDLEAWWYAQSIIAALDRCAKSGGLSRAASGYMPHWFVNTPPFFGVWTTFDAANKFTVSVEQRKLDAENLRRKLVSVGVTVVGTTSEGAIAIGGPTSPSIFVGPRRPPDMPTTVRTP